MEECQRRAKDELGAKDYEGRSTGQKPGREDARLAPKLLSLVFFYASFQSAGFCFFVGDPKGLIVFMSKIREAQVSLPIMTGLTNPVLCSGASSDFGADINKRCSRQWKSGRKAVASPTKGSIPFLTTGNKCERHSTNAKNSQVSKVCWLEGLFRIPIFSLRWIKPVADGVARAFDFPGDEPGRTVKNPLQWGFWCGAKGLSSSPALLENSGPFHIYRKPSRQWDF
nr:hypothetical protein Iba_chr07cCG4270 [Ipomoea batatas]